MQKHTLSSLLFLLIVTAFATFCYLMVPNIDDNLDGSLSTFDQYREMKPGVAKIVLHYRPTDVIKPSVWIWQGEHEEVLGDLGPGNGVQRAIP